MVDELIDSGLQIRFILADAKERHFLMGLCTVTATFACESCMTKCVRMTVGGRLYIAFPR